MKQHALFVSLISHKAGIPHARPLIHRPLLLYRDFLPHKIKLLQAAGFFRGAFTSVAERNGRSIPQLWDTWTALHLNLSQATLSSPLATPPLSPIYTHPVRCALHNQLCPSPCEVPPCTPTCMAISVVHIVSHNWGIQNLMHWLNKVCHMREKLLQKEDWVCCTSSETLQQVTASPLPWLLCLGPVESRVVDHWWNPRDRDRSARDVVCRQRGTGVGRPRGITSFVIPIERVDRNNLARLQRVTVRGKAKRGRRLLLLPLLQSCSWPLLVQDGRQQMGHCHLA